MNAAGILGLQQSKAAQAENRRLEQALGSRTMDQRRVGAVVFVAVAITATAIEMNRKEEVREAWPSDRTTQAQGDALNVNAAWTYPDPTPGAEGIRDHIAFWKGVSASARNGHDLDRLLAAARLAGAGLEQVVRG
jgi:hypothetical protein